MYRTDIFAALAFVISIAAYAPYVRSIIVGVSKPTISSWISWGIMDTAVLVAMISAGSIAWQVVAYIAGVVAVLATCTYKGAILDWKRLDTICLGIVITGIALWALSGSPEVGITVSLISAIVGSVPMIYNIWKDPTREALLPWALYLAGGVCGVMAIPSMTLAGALPPIIFVFLQMLGVALISRKFLQAS